MPGFTSTTITRPVSNGKVFCLVQAQRLRVERCSACDIRASVVTDDTDSPIAILCRPPLAALLSPTAHQGLPDLDWSW